MTTYYTYMHTRNDTGRPFYVGKGKRDRAHSTGGRNSYWRNIASKCGYAVHILAHWPTESEAFSHEKLLISSFRDMGVELVNMTNGGEGFDGVVISEDARNRAREKLKNRLFTEAHRQRISQAKTGAKRPDNAERNRVASAKLKGQKLNISAQERSRRSAAGKVHGRENASQMWAQMTADERQRRSLLAREQMLRVWAARRSKNGGA